MRKLVFAVLMLPALAHKRQGKGIAGNKKPPVGGFLYTRDLCLKFFLNRFVNFS